MNNQTKALSFGRLFTATEQHIFTICFVLAIVNLALWLTTDSKIDLAGYILAIIVISSLILIGLLYRHGRKGGERIGKTMLCTAALLLFSNVGSMLNYLMLPFSGDTIDNQLASIDLAMGFHWLEFLKFSSQWPMFSTVLGISYNSSLLQVIVVILILGFKGHSKSLDDFLYCFVLSAIITIGFWFFFPSFGPTAMYTIPEEIVRLVNPVVGNDYGLYLQQLKTTSPLEISPNNIKGIIAMPSYHTVMAILTCYAVAGVPRWRVFFFMINAFVLLSVPLHGGHHLIDLIGGVFVSLVVIIVFSNRRRRHTNEEYT